jgi:hypothetical protein
MPCLQPDAYYSRTVRISIPSRSQSAKARPGSLERPLSARIYRGAWFVVAIPVLIAAFSVVREQPLTPPESASTQAFDTDGVARTMQTLANEHPDRSPGAPNSETLLGWVRDQFRDLGLETHVDRFSARIPGFGKESLANLSATVPGRSSTEIVVVAHRDNSGQGPGGGADDNASGTALMLELARAYQTGTGLASPPVPAHTLVFLSTDGGAFGAIGADRFAHLPGARQRIAAVIVLDSIAGDGPVHVLFNGDSPSSASPILVATAYQLLGDQPGIELSNPGSVHQLLDLAFPFSLFEQAPFVSEGIPAVTITTAGDRPPNPFTDTPERALDSTPTARLSQVGRASEQLLGALDQGAPEPREGRSSYIYLGGRFVRGWAIQFILIAAVLPPLVAIVDLFARCRRRHIPLRPAFRSLGRRLGFWLSILVLFRFFAFVGFWPSGLARPPSLDSSAVTSAPLVALVAFAFLGFGAWLVARNRLLPHEHASPEDTLAGYTSALIVIAAVSIFVAILNPYAILFVLLPLHVWIWAPQLRHRNPWTPPALLALGLLGPLILLWELAARLHLGLDVIWYVTELSVVGYIGLATLILIAVMAAASAQLAALSVGRYAPYPADADLPDATLPQRVARYFVSMSRRLGESRRAHHAHGD